MGYGQRIACRNVKDRQLEMGLNNTWKVKKKALATEVSCILLAQYVNSD